MGHGRYSRAIVFKATLLPKNLNIYHHGVSRALLRQFPGAPIGVKNSRRVSVLPGDSGDKLKSSVCGVFRVVNGDVGLYKVQDASLVQLELDRNARVLKAELQSNDNGRQLAKGNRPIFLMPDVSLTHNFYY